MNCIFLWGNCRGHSFNRTAIVPGLWCDRHTLIHSSSSLWGHPNFHAGPLGLFLPLPGHTEWCAVCVGGPQGAHGARVVLPPLRFQPCFIMLTWWSVHECIGSVPAAVWTSLGTAALVWAPIQPGLSVQMDSTFITIYSELMCPSMCWPSVFPLHSDFWALRGVSYCMFETEAAGSRWNYPFWCSARSWLWLWGAACVKLWERHCNTGHNHSLHLLTLTSQATF